MKIVIGSEGMGFNKNWRTGDVIITYLLKKIYPNVEIENKNTPHCDFIMSSLFSNHEPLWNTQKNKYIYWSGESDDPVKNSCASTELYITTTHNSNANHIYTPYVLYSPHLYKERKYINNNRPYLLAYCSSHRCYEREEIFNMFVRKTNYKMCHSYGKCHGNFPSTKQVSIGGNWQTEELIDTYKNYKFVIAMENKNVDGYITEKIVNAFYSGAIPIFWGSSNVNALFNEKAFINVNNFITFEACVDYVLALSDEDINKMLKEPIYTNNDLVHLLDDEYNKNGNKILTLYLNKLKSFLEV
jgi:hypothetical protein